MVDTRALGIGKRPMLQKVGKKLPGGIVEMIGGGTVVTKVLEGVEKARR